MPGSIQNSAPFALPPRSLWRAFVHDRSHPVIENENRYGEPQRSAQATTSRKRWKLAKGLSPSALAALRDFYDARKGATEPFYFYDPYGDESEVPHDPTGRLTAGRHTIRFDGERSQSVPIAG